MTRGVRLYLVGSFVLVSLAGCGRGFFQSAEREPWRAEAELACLKSGAVKENAELVRISPISGPGVCGAEYPLKVAALGDSDRSFGFADELRPPGYVGNQPRWPVSQPPSAAPVRQQGYGAAAGGPISLTAPGVNPENDDIALAPEGTPGFREPADQESVSARPQPGAVFGTPCPAGTAAARAGAGQSGRRLRAGGDEARCDAGLPDRVGARSLARRIPCSLLHCAGSAPA